MPSRRAFGVEGRGHSKEGSPKSAEASDSRAFPSRAGRVDVVGCGPVGPLDPQHAYLARIIVSDEGLESPDRHRRRAHALEPAEMLGKGGRTSHGAGRRCDRILRVDLCGRSRAVVQVPRRSRARLEPDGCPRWLKACRSPTPNERQISGPRRSGPAIHDSCAPNVIKRVARFLQSRRSTHRRIKTSSLEAEDRNGSDRQNGGSRDRRGRWRSRNFTPSSSESAANRDFLALSLICLRHDVRVGSGATRTRVFPKFSPRSISAKAWGMTSNPSRISSR
jgi:hypothetical protein